MVAHRHLHDVEEGKFQTDVVLSQQPLLAPKFQGSFNVKFGHRRRLFSMLTRIASWVAATRNSRMRQILSAALLAAVCLLGLIVHRAYDLQSHRSLSFPTPDSATGFSADLRATAFKKPENVAIIGLVFFGRKSRVEILRCYLERNLVDYGGWLDEIHWVKNTDNPEDLKYLDEIIASSSRYKVVELDGVGFVGYGQAWTKLRAGSLYVKIDDDVVWFEDDTIPQIVSMKLKHPEYLLVSANMINSPLMGWVHYHLGALHPYLPEIVDHTPGFFDMGKFSRKSWKYSSYPNWSGPEDYFFGLVQEPPFDGHRWLRMPDQADLSRTPASEIEYLTWGTGLKSWAIAAQEHYSFLENLANQDLDVYRMGVSSRYHPEGKAWLTDGQRLSINFIAIWADDVLDNLPMDTVDEEWLTINLPTKLRRSVAVNTNALAVHFTFGTQGNVEKTDLLARYHGYALEERCARLI